MANKDFEFDDIHPSKWTKERLVQEVLSQREAADVKEGTIDGMITRQRILKGMVKEQERVIIVKKKSKGHMDPMAWRLWRKQAKLQILINLLSAPAIIMTAAMAGEFSWWLVGLTAANSIFGPYIFYLQKKSERY